jgi:hypothetical protein
VSEPCIHCGENQMGINDDACWSCFGLERSKADAASAEIDRLRVRLEAAEKMAEALRRCEHALMCNSWLGRECDCSIPDALAAWEASQ